MRTFLKWPDLLALLAVIPIEIWNFSALSLVVHSIEELNIKSLNSLNMFIILCWWYGFVLKIDKIEGWQSPAQREIPLILFTFLNILPLISLQLFTIIFGFCILRHVSNREGNEGTDVRMDLLKSEREYDAWLDGVWAVHTHPCTATLQQHA